MPIPAYSDKNMPFNVSAAALIPASILTSVTYTSPILPLFYGDPYISALIGYNQIVIALTSDHVVTITIQRYLDAAGLIPVGAAATQATTANVAGYCATSATIPAFYFGFTIANASGSTAVITNSGVALLPNAS